MFISFFYFVLPNNTSSTNLHPSRVHKFLYNDDETFVGELMNAILRDLTSLSTVDNGP